jgi:hypothetical protein
LTGGVCQVGRYVVKGYVLQRLKHDGHGNVVAVDKGDVVIGVAVAGVEGEFGKGDRYITLVNISACSYKREIKG